MTAAVTSGSAPDAGRAVAALDALAAGHSVLFVGGLSGDGEADIVFAAGTATPESVAFAVRHGSGFICAALPETTADRLRLLPIGEFWQRGRVAFGVAFDAAEGVSTGISARDRARALTLVGTPGTAPGDLTRPGHTVPFRTAEGGVLVRRGRAEAAVDLIAMGGAPAPAAAMVRLVSADDPRRNATGPELAQFAAAFGLVVVDAGDVVALRSAAPGPRAPGAAARTLTTTLLEER